MSLLFESSLTPLFLTDGAPGLAPALVPHLALGAGVLGAVYRLLVFVAAAIVAVQGGALALPAKVRFLADAALVARVLLAVVAQGL